MLAPYIDVADRWEFLLDVMGTATDDRTQRGSGTAFVALSPSLQPLQVEYGWNVVLKSLEDASADRGDGDGIWAASGTLTALAPLIDRQHASGTVDRLIRQLGETKWTASLTGVGEVLVALAPKLRPEELQRALDKYVSAFEARGRPRTNSALVGVRLAKSLSAESASETSLRVLKTLFDSNAVTSASPGREQDELADFTRLVNAAISPSAIAPLLAHPGCESEFRDILLHRFEHLVLHGGRLLDVPTKKSSSGTPTNRSEQPREFRTVHDASAWIERNWTDFNLDVAPSFQ